MLWGGWGEKKREHAGHDGKGKERTEVKDRGFSPFLSSHRPPRAFFFFQLLLFFYRDTRRGPLRRREAIHSIEIYPVDSVIHVLNNWRLNFIQLAYRTR